MNFLIFTNFYGIFLKIFWILYEFNSIYFELKWIKIIFLSRANLAANMERKKMAVPHDDVWEHHVSHTCACAHVCACVINENKHSF